MGWLFNRRPKHIREASQLYNIILTRDFIKTTEQDTVEQDTVDHDRLIAHTDKIVCNIETPEGKSFFRENMFVKSYKINNAESIGTNQGVEQPEGHRQTAGTFEKSYTLHGIITKIAGNNNDGDNTIINRLINWEEEQKRNNNLRDGRFGIIFNAPARHTTVPYTFGTNRRGLILQYLNFDFYPAFPPANSFEIKFIRSRSDGT